MYAYACMHIYCMYIHGTSIMLVAHFCAFRESAEQRVKELQYLLNETFKRFSIDYDEDDVEELSDEVSEL